MSKDDNLILQIGDEERNPTTEKKKLNNGKKELNNEKKELIDEKRNATKLNEWEDRVIVIKMETKIFDVRRDGRITIYETRQGSERRKNHDIRNPTRKRIHTTDI